MEVCQFTYTEHNTVSKKCDLSGRKLPADTAFLRGRLILIVGMFKLSH